MHILLFIFIIWISGLLITIIHESGHAFSMVGKVGYIRIGVKIWKPITIGKFIIYPLFPFAGETKLTLECPSKENIIILLVTGVLAGFTVCLLAGFIGLNLLTSEETVNLLISHKMRFLLVKIVDGTACTQTVIGTALITSSILYGTQQIGNLFPVPGYDGHKILNTLLPR